MELRSLRHVVVLARHLNFNRAAEELGLTQPALTRSIQVTEERCRLRLFDRDRGGVSLTMHGKAFVRRAEGLLREAADFERVLQRYADGAEEEVSFGMTPFVASTCLSSLLQELLREHPRLKINTPVRRIGGLLRLLIDEEIEFLVCPKGRLPRDTPVRTVSLGSVTLSLVVRAGHPLLHGDSHKASYPVISSAHFDAGSGSGGLLRPGATAPPQLVIENVEALRTLALSTDSIWITSPLAAQHEISQGRLVELPRPAGEVQPMSEISLCCLDRRTASPLMLNIQTRLSKLLPAPAEPV